ncbi:phage upper tail fiber protein [Kocuria rosea]|uniref:phage upper tail fiber protein n=1 Tax=Kocuria rosea TaxID=1275 RepID=UPI003D33B110
MAYPAGTTLARISVGGVIDTFGDDASVSVTVTPVYGGQVTHLVHAATGIVMIPTTRTFDGGPGGEATFDVPHTDLPGWLGPGGVPAPQWAYRVVVTARDTTGKAVTFEKTINAPQAQTGTQDFDLIPAGTPVDPINGAVAAVLSIDGKTGHLTAADLPASPLPTHNHTTAEVTGLDTALAGKAATAHSHAAADITSGTLAAARLPAATTSAAGSMSAVDKTKLDNATSAATASRLVMRDAAGRTQHADPAVAADSATMGWTQTQLAGKASTAQAVPAGGTSGQVLAKTSATDYATGWITPTTGGGGVTDHGALTGLTDDDHPQYALANGSRGSFAAPTHNHTTAEVTGLDTALAGKAATAHSHTAAEITSGTLAAARLPAATTSTAGSMSSADKTKLDNATSAATASRLVMRDAAGRTQHAEPAVAADSATKGYVDARTWVGTQAAYDAIATKDGTVNYLITG